jgi:hypothetical protein
MKYVASGYYPAHEKRHKGLSKSDERAARRYAVRCVGGAGDGHGLVIGLHDVRAGATLALKERLLPLTPGTSQLPYLVVYLIEGITQLGLQTHLPVIGEVLREAPRFFEEHTHVLQLR